MRNIFKFLISIYLSLSFLNNALNTSTVQPYGQEGINKSSKNDEITFKFNFANNFLFIADTKERI